VEVLRNTGATLTPVVQHPLSPAGQGILQAFPLWTSRGSANTLVGWVSGTGTGPATVQVHDVADGGALVAVAEMALAGNVGARLELAAFESRMASEREQHAWSLFGETQARYIVTERFDTDAVEKLARDSGIRCCFIGWTGGETLALCKGETAVYPELALSTLREANEAFFRDWMEA
ncbi:MAG: AIR synthase-related protein, partial [Novosphingobium sp.]